MKISCFRKLKDKTTSESDGRSANSSFMNHRNHSELLDLCRRSTPKIVLHRLPPSMIMRYRNKSIDSGICSQQLATPCDDTLDPNSTHLERLLSIQTPPPEPSLVSGTSTSTQNSYPGDSFTPRLLRSSSKREYAPRYKFHKK